MSNNFEKRREEKVNDEKKRLKFAGFTEEKIVNDKSSMFIFSFVLSLAVVILTLYILKADINMLISFFKEINNILLLFIIILVLQFIKELIRGGILYLFSLGKKNSIEIVLRRNMELFFYSTIALSVKAYILVYIFPFIITGLIPIIIGIILNSFLIVFVGIVMTIILSKDVYIAYMLNKIKNRNNILCIEDISGKNIYIYKKK